MVTKNLKKVICVATIVAAALCFVKKGNAQCYYHDESNPTTIRRFCVKIKVISEIFLILLRAQKISE
jgi:hypothetical protein